MSEETESTELAGELVLEQMEADKTAPNEHHWHKLVALLSRISADEAATQNYYQLRLRYLSLLDYNYIY